MLCHGPGWEGPWSKISSRFGLGWVLEPVACMAVMYSKVWLCLAHRSVSLLHLVILLFLVLVIIALEGLLR